jgi:hypothetical protein
MPLTLPEELLLLMLDDTTGQVLDRAVPAGDYALAGAVLAELALLGRIDTDPQHLYVIDATPTGDATLDPALALLRAAPGSQASRGWIETLAAEAPALREALFARLVAQGVLRQQESRFLWMYAERRYPQVSGREEREVKARLTGVLFNDAIPEPRDALLLGLAQAANLLGVFLSAGEIARAEPRIAQVVALEELNRSLAAAVRAIFAHIARYAYLA